MCILSAVRTPLGSLGGVLAPVSAVDLGATAIRAAVKKSKVDPNMVGEVFFGCTLPMGLGQSPARQAALRAGLNKKVVCTCINKVCASGMKAVMLATNSIRVGDRDVLVAGGMESMSNVPRFFYVPRKGKYKLGDLKFAEDGKPLFNEKQDVLKDSLLLDGLTDGVNQVLMGLVAEQCADRGKHTKKDQDEYAKESYRRARSAYEQRAFMDEIVPVEVKDPIDPAKTVIVAQDEECFLRPDLSKIDSAKPVFRKPGSVTPGNSSPISDGASALVLANGNYVKQHNLTVHARILAHADYAADPLEFTEAPSGAVSEAVAKAGLQLKDIDYFEINEAFAVVALRNMSLLGLDPKKVNVLGGAVSLGHPLGCSGARILATLITVLQRNRARYGCAAICNGGGGASAIILERITDDRPASAKLELRLDDSATPTSPLPSLPPSPLSSPPPSPVAPVEPQFAPVEPPQKEKKKEAEVEQGEKKEESVAKKPRTN